MHILRELYLYVRTDHYIRSQFHKAQMHWSHV